jgi:hypothetical protein
MTGTTDRHRWAALAATAVLAVAGVTLYLNSEAHELHDPEHSLQQLDLLYLDEPAPGLAELGFDPGSPAVLVFCSIACPLPGISGAQVIRSQDPALAAQYALLTRSGRIGPGYALVDAEGTLHYRTFDPGLADHEPEIQILVEGL